MKKIFFFIILVLIISTIKLFSTNTFSPQKALTLYNNVYTIKKIEHAVNLHTNVKLVIWKNKNNNILGSILKKNILNSWKVVGQSSVVNTSSTTLNEFVYSKINFSNSSSKYTHLFLGYINNLNNIPINRITLDDYECNLIFDDNENIIWYIFLNYSDDTLPVLKMYKNNELLFSY